MLKGMKLLVAMLVLVSGGCFALGVNASTVRPEMTPPPAEGALAMKDIGPVYSRALPEAPKVAPKKVMMTTADPETKPGEQAGTQQDFDLMMKPEVKNMEDDKTLSLNEGPEQQEQKNVKEMGQDKDINFGKMKPTADGNGAAGAGSDRDSTAENGEMKKMILADGADGNGNVGGMSNMGEDRNVDSMG